MISTPAPSASDNAFASSQVKALMGRIANDLELEDRWEQELDVVGAAATRDELQDLLDRAPNPESGTAQFLLGYLMNVPTTQRSERASAG